MFLIFTLGLFIYWFILYTLLNSYDILLFFLIRLNNLINKIKGLIKIINDYIKAHIILLIIFLVQLYLLLFILFIFELILYYLKLLLNIPIDNNDDDLITECAICFEPIEFYNIFITECNHKYHRNCIYQWKKNNCPLCRRII